MASFPPVMVGRMGTVLLPPRLRLAKAVAVWWSTSRCNVDLGLSLGFFFYFFCVFESDGNNNVSLCDIQESVCIQTAGRFFIVLDRGSFLFL